MNAKITRSLLFPGAALCLLVASTGAHAVTQCNGTVEVLGHSLRLVPYDNAQLTVKAKYAAANARPDRIVVVGTNATVHHSRDGEKRTTPVQLSYQFAPNTPRAVEDSTRIAVRWCAEKAPCQIDKIEVAAVSCTEFGK